MSIEINILSALATGIASSTVAEELWDVFKSALRKTGQSDVPEYAVSDIDRKKATQFIIEKEATLDKAKKDELARTVREALDQAQTAAEDIRRERIRQAQRTFNTAIALLIIGVVIIFVGVGIMFAGGNLGGGGITAGIGAITEIISALVFKFNHDTNNRLDEIQKDLSAIEKAQIALSLSSHITDSARRDEAIAEVIKELNRKS